MSAQNAATSRANGMKVLLLHPADNFPLPGSTRKWDLVVDFGRAPLSSYQRWSQEAGCKAIGLHEFAEEIADLHRVGEFLQSARGQIVDRDGIDWWDTLSTMIWHNLLRLFLVQRLARELTPACELYMSRPIAEAKVLQAILGVQAISLEGRYRAAFRRVWRPFAAIARLDNAQLLQILWDKFDSEHVVRNRLTRRKPGLGQPMVLLPSAYINVSRTAVSYAKLLPDSQFLLVCTRNVAKLKVLPSNVRMVSLDGYFGPPDPNEIASLLKSWSRLKERLNSHEEFAAANASGLLDGFPGHLRWGITVRDAWKRLLDSQNIVGCLSADDGNPYTLIPLILARKRGLPTLACHHGALDFSIPMKTLHSDFYLAKTEMERDFLLNVCRVSPDVVVDGAFASSQASPQPVDEGLRRHWLVFFTEAYVAPWRAEEIYRELMPALASLANRCGLRLVFKLHPFESARDFRRLLRRHFSPKLESQIGMIAGPSSAELWRNIRFAVTIQSTIALECRERGIPVFLCAWLRDPYGGYLKQFARFGVGHELSSPEHIADIPRLLESKDVASFVEGHPWQTMEPAKLRSLLCGVGSSNKLQPKLEHSGD